MQSNIGSQKNAAFTTGMKLGKLESDVKRRGFDDFVFNLRRKIGEAMTFLSHCDD